MNSPTETVDINYYNNNNNKGFFTKKKIFLTIFLLLLFILIIALCSKFFLDIKFDIVFNLLKKSYYNNKLFFLWIFLLILFPIFNLYWRIFPFWYQLKKEQYIVKWYEWFNLSLVCFFISAITPFSTGSEPYIIYWLKRQGVNLKKATSLVAASTMVGPWVQILITWPSFFIISTQYSNLSTHWEWKTIFWSIFGGLLFDLLGAFFWFFVNYSKKCHYIFNLFLNWVKKIFKKPFKSKKEIEEEFIKNASYQKLFLSYFKDYKFLISLILVPLIWNIYYYICVYFAFQMIDSTCGINAWNLFNFANVATTANNFIPIPGAEGTLQYSLSVLIQYSNDFNKNLTFDDIKNISTSSIFVWRFFTFYLLAILGTLSFLYIIYNEVFKILIKKKKEKINQHDKSFTILIPYYNANKFINNALRSIRNIHYDKNLIQVIIVDDGSSEKEKDVIEDYMSKYSYIEYYRKENSQWGGVINYAIQNDLIKNEYVSVLDSDDFLDMNVYTNINNIIGSFDMYVGQFKKFDGKKIRKSVSPYWYLFKKIFTNKKQMNSPFCAPLTYFIKSEVFKKMHKLNENMAYQDPDYLSQLVLNSNSIRYMRKVVAFYYYNRENNSVSQKWDEKRFNAEFNACLKCINNDAQEIVSFRLNNKEFRKILKEKKIKFKIKRDFCFKWFPFYIRWMYYLLHKKRNKEFFIYDK